MSTDKNFDNVAERFAHRIYNSLKGEIRQQVLWRDLGECLPVSSSDKPLRVLDIGGGLGQFSIRLAACGHHVHFNDISTVMTEKAQMAAKEAGVFEQIKWTIAPYQQLIPTLKEPYDLILCHAVIEWLARPSDLIMNLAKVMTEKSVLSLCFYNPAGKIYRNLIRGNFNWLANQQQYHSNAKSLTPNNPSSYEDVSQWLQAAGLQFDRVSGIRVFSDYVVEKRGGLQSDEAVLLQELEYSQQEPYKWLGRYLHIQAHK